MAHTAHIGYGVGYFELRYIEVRNRVWAIFKLAVRIAQSFETNEIWVKLRTGQDLETGQV